MAKMNWNKNRPGWANAFKPSKPGRRLKFKSGPTIDIIKKNKKKPKKKKKYKPSQEYLSAIKEIEKFD